MNKCKLVSNIETPRTKLFKKAISKLNDYSITGKVDNTTLDTANYNIYFSSEHFKTLLESKEKETICVLDVPDTSVFKEDKAGSLMILNIVCADFVTCQNAKDQEEIYSNTGRLAAIVENPIDDKSFIQPLSKTNNKNLNVLWYGEARDIFSYKTYQNKYKAKHKMNALIYLEVPRKRAQNILERADLVFFPKTYNEDSEYARRNKVEEAVMFGKFVIAPELDTDFAFTGTFEQGIEFYNNCQDIPLWIKLVQEELKQRVGLENTMNQLETALEQAPKDEFFNDLDYYIENEEIKI